MKSQSPAIIPSLLLVMLSIIGIADAGYITYEELQGVIPPCGPGFDCGAVLNSPYAQIGPVPLAAVGLVYYAMILLLSILQVSEFDLQRVFPRRSWFRHITILDVLAVLTVGGLFFSVYLVSIMAFVIEAWCKFCLISAATSAFLFLTTQWAVHTKTNSSVFLKGLLHSALSFKYAKIIKPIFFLLDPEFVHEKMIRLGALLGSNPAGRWFLRAFFGFHHQGLFQTHHQITFPNPIGLSAGFDYNGDLCDVVGPLGFGWHTIGTVTLGAYPGNTRPRLGRFPRSQALLVNKGLKSIGTQAVIAKLQHKKLTIPTAISIASTNKKFTSLKEQLLDITTSFVLFERSSVQHQLYELNISCPNTFGGEPFSTPERLEVLLQLLDRLQLRQPLFLKMPIDQSEDETLALLTVLKKHVVAGVIFGNLTKDKTNPAVHPQDREDWKTMKGNLSGRPTFERSNALIKLARKHLPAEIIVIGTGGIFTPEDVGVKHANGAVLYQLITGMIYQGPQLLGQLNRSLLLKKELSDL